MRRARQEQVAHKALLEQLERPEPLVRPAHKAQLEQLARLEQLEPQAPPEHKARLAQRELLVRPAQPVLSDLRVQLVL